MDASLFMMYKRNAKANYGRKSSKYNFYGKTWLGQTEF